VRAPPRAVVAAGLLTALLGALLVAWFASGWADVRGQQRMVRAAPGQAAERRGAELAHELRGELSAVLAREVERPYFHYQNLFHDPRASAGPSVAPSPLAKGPEDALVAGYFQLDTHGKTTTPTINDELPELSEARGLADNRRFRDEVRRSLAGVLAPVGAGPLVAVLDPPPDSPRVVAGSSPRPPRVEPQRQAGARSPPAHRDEPQQPPRAASDPPPQVVPQAPPPQVAQQAPPPQVAQQAPPPQVAQQAQVVTIDPDTYIQNNASNEIYRQQRVANAPVSVGKPQGDLTVMDPARDAVQQARVRERSRLTANAEQAASPPLVPGLAPNAEPAGSPSLNDAEAQRPGTAQAVAPPDRGRDAAASPGTAQRERPGAGRGEPVTAGDGNTPATIAAGAARAGAGEQPAPGGDPAHSHAAGERRLVTPSRAERSLPRPSRASSAPAPTQPAPITITVSPFEWRTLPFAGQPAVVAVRQVTTPDGPLAQGFVIDRAALTGWLAGHAGDAVAELRTGDNGTTEIVPGWHLEVAANPRAVVAANLASSAIARGFVMRFIAIGAIAIIAALLVVLLVARAERLARERSQFAAAAAHELRTPLAGLQLYGDMIADGLGDPGKLRDYARRMSEEASRLGRVVSNVLGFSQLERGNLSVEPRPGALGEALCALAERAQPALDRAGATLALDVAPELAATFDRDALARIVGNLLDNAEKYGRQSDDRTITLAARTAGDTVEIIVSDHGPGIAPAARTRLFQPFKRGVSADGPAGLGLGLALSQSLARAMGGELAYRPAADGGAAFVLTLAAG